MLAIVDGVTRTRGHNGDVPKEEGPLQSLAVARRVIRELSDQLLDAPKLERPGLMDRIDHIIGHWAQQGKRVLVEPPKPAPAPKGDYSMEAEISRGR